MIESYPVSWFEKVIVNHDRVDGAMAIDDREVRVVRKALDPITVVPVRSDFLVREDLEELLVDHKPTLVVLVNRAGHYAWEARQLAEDQGASRLTCMVASQIIETARTLLCCSRRLRTKLTPLSTPPRGSESGRKVYSSLKVGTFDPLRIAVEQHCEFTALRSSWG